VPLDTVGPGRICVGGRAAESTVRNSFQIEQSELTVLEVFRRYGRIMRGA
jgi:hypothetical protein